jgi:hypothetical protein
MPIRPTGGRKRNGHSWAPHAGQYDARARLAVRGGRLAAVEHPGAAGGRVDGAAQSGQLGVPIRRVEIVFYHDGARLRDEWNPISSK